ncbi:MAG TPA: ABC transporter ATP-binding protein [Solirubrobacteraceae bacterium]|nr:ABC transporter ATP-binding protein [Solirubrobacteraceae bacterium]
MRWRVRGLYLNPSLAARLTVALAGTAGVIEVSSNAQTGKMLVVFGEATTTVEQLEALMLQAMGPDGIVAADPARSRPLLGRHGREIKLGIAFSGAASAASLARIFFLRRTLNALLRSPVGVVARAGPSAVLMVVSTLLYVRLKRSNRLVWSRVGRRRQLELRMEVASRLARADFVALDRVSISDLANTVRSNLAAIERGFDGAGELVYVAGNTIVLTAAFVVVAPGLSWIPIVVLVAMALDARSSHLPVQQRHHDADARRNLADRHLTELIDGLPTVKSFGFAARKLDRLLAAARDYEEASNNVAAMATRAPLRLELMTMLGVDAVALGAGIAVAAGAMGPATQVALIAIAGHLFYAFGSLGPSLDSANRGWAASTVLREVCQMPLETNGPQWAIPPAPPRVAITLDNVEFRYPTRDAPALRQVSLRIAAGSFVGVVGPSGSGKSTIMKLLLRFYDPTEGAIRIDGTDIRRFDRAELRALIASVDAQSFIFDDTIAGNIAVGKEDADEAEIRDRARAALLDEFVELLPDGYASETGARGGRLSDGQRQRLLLARALLKPAPVVILDEATSHVDTTTEEILLSNICARTAGRTLIVIAHRLAAVKDADTIFVLDDGRIVESGSHAELLARKEGVYRSLWRSQHRPPRAGP